MDSLQAYAAFARAIEIGSFSAVGRELKVAQSTISKQIAALEANLGIQLFARTTRRLQPTPEALRLYEHVRQLLDAVEMVKSSAGQRAAEASGILRVTMPRSFGRRRILPLLPRFSARYPLVTVEALLSDQIVDLVEEGVELGIRIGNLPPSTLIGRSLGIVEHLVVASPGYLARRGTPETPTELARHNCLVYGTATRWNRWDFESEHGRHSVTVAGSLRISDQDALHEAALADQGVACLPDWLASNDVAEGRLVALLPEFYPIPQPINLIYPQTRYLTPRARAFIDFLTEERAPGRGALAP